MRWNDEAVSHDSLRITPKPNINQPNLTLSLLVSVDTNLITREWLDGN